MLDEAEAILRANPDVESYSRRLGTELGMFITEPYRGDFAVKLKAEPQTHDRGSHRQIAPRFQRAVPG